MPPRITIELTGEAELQAKLNKLAQGLTNPQPLLSEIGATLEANIQRRFDLGVDPNGRKWAPLSAATLEFYKVKAGRAKADGIGAKLTRGDFKAVAAAGRAPSNVASHLQQTGRLRDSLKVNVLGNAVEVGMLRLTDNGKWNVAALHEFGTQRGKGGMPRRGLLTADPNAGTLGAEDRADVMDVVQRYIDRLA